ncbi:unnamed protein product [Leptidea sinapis]|uniref:Uncharacterized protein n=1 Tax=Leptidea sinapis TaxID=189913 RepID=A0A5E4QDZ0_9NEOP|nr:unnamed protein product [Leptidea sinapis]
MWKQTDKQINRVSLTLHVNMDERKILFFIFFLIIYCLYNVNMWLMGINNRETLTETKQQPEIKRFIPEKSTERKPIPLFFKDACSVLDIFTKAPKFIYKPKVKKRKTMDTANNTISMIGITVFLVILVLNAAIEVIKEKEERKKKSVPELDRRQSLAEFANKKPLRRESSKFGPQLFQIDESMGNDSEDKDSRRRTRPYTRGESINSYLSDKKQEVETAPGSVGETNAERKILKRQSIEVQALMLTNRQPSLDSDDESDGKARRVRIIRRY